MGLKFSTRTGDKPLVFNDVLTSSLRPDPTGSNRADLDYLLLNILDPSAEVAQDYRMSIVATRDGNALRWSGLKSNAAHRQQCKRGQQSCWPRRVLGQRTHRGIFSSARSGMRSSVHNRGES